jgi:hypothetical protein
VGPLRYHYQETLYETHSTGVLRCRCTPLGAHVLFAYAPLLGSLAPCTTWSSEFISWVVHDLRFAKSSASAGLYPENCTVCDTRFHMAAWEFDFVKCAICSEWKHALGGESLHGSQLACAASVHEQVHAFGYCRSLLPRSVFSPPCGSPPLLRSSPRPISTSQLNELPRLHIWPIYLVFYQGSYQLSLWDILS